MTVRVEPELYNAHFGVFYLELKCWQITRAFTQKNLLMWMLSDRTESQSTPEILPHRFTKYQDSNGRKTKGYFPHIYWTPEGRFVRFSRKAAALLSCRRVIAK